MKAIADVKERINLKWKSKEEIQSANLADWEKEVILENFEFEQNLSEIAKVVREYVELKKKNGGAQMTYNGWTNWDTWEAYGIITSNDEKAYNLILRQLKKSDYLGIRSIKAYIKTHNKQLKKSGREHLIIDLDSINLSELLESLKEHLEE